VDFIPSKDIFMGLFHGKNYNKKLLR